MKYKKHILLLFVLLLACSLVYFLVPNKPIEKPYSTVLLDHQGQLLGAKIAQDEQWRFPVLDSLNPKYEACLLMFEDQYFYYHPGLNPASLWAALQTNLSKGKIKRGECHHHAISPYGQR